VRLVTGDTSSAHVLVPVEKRDRSVIVIRSSSLRYALSKSVGR